MNLNFVKAIKGKDDDKLKEIFKDAFLELGNCFDSNENQELKHVSTVFVCDEDKVIGTFTLHFDPSDEFLIFHHFVILKSERNKGYATKILDTLGLMLNSLEYQGIKSILYKFSEENKDYEFADKFFSKYFNYYEDKLNKNIDYLSNYNDITKSEDGAFEVVYVKDYDKLNAFFKEEEYEFINSLLDDMYVIKEIYLEDVNSEKAELLIGGCNFINNGFTLNKTCLNYLQAKCLSYRYKDKKIDELFDRIIKLYKL